MVTTTTAEITIPKINGSLESVGFVAVYTYWVPVNYDKIIYNPPIEEPVFKTEIDTKIPFSKEDDFTLIAPLNITEPFLI